MNYWVCKEDYTYLSVCACEYNKDCEFDEYLENFFFLKMILIN